MGSNQAQSRRRWAQATAALALLLAAIAFSACGGSGGSDTTGGGEATGSGEATGGGEASPIIAESEQLLEKDASKGFNGKLPSSAPTPKKGAKVWVMACTLVTTGCHDGSAGAVEAAEALGWDVTLFNAKAEPKRANEGIREAIAAGADAFINVSTDCGPIKNSLEQAHKAGMVIVSFWAYDCTDPSQGGKGPKLFDRETQMLPDMSNVEATELTGALQAAWAVVHWDGDVKAMNFDNTEEATAIYVNKGFEDYLQKCDSCEITETVPFLLSELGAPLTQKARSALLKNPDTNTASTPYDPVAEGVAPAIVSLGKTDDVANLGALASSSNITLISEDRGQAMTIAWPAFWLGWASIDDVVRMLAGEEPVYSGWGMKALDAENLEPGADSYEPPLDFKANYEKIWGVSK